MSTYPHIRMRRNRQYDWSRRLVRENHLSVDELIWTIVVSDGNTPRDPVPSMPGVDRVNIPALVEDAKRAQDLGIPAIAMFPHINPKFKDAEGSEAFNPNGLIPQAIRAVKAAAPDLGVIVDVALDPYTDHGHDGLMKDGIILNDPTVENPCARCCCSPPKPALIWSLPSDMMDGRVAAIRQITGRPQAISKM